MRNNKQKKIERADGVGYYYIMPNKYINNQTFPNKKAWLLPHRDKGREVHGNNNLI
jgi:hypothetical protein